MHVDTHIVCCDTYSFFSLKCQPEEREFTKGLNMCDSQVIRLTPPTLPSLLSILKDFQVRQYVQVACDTEDTSNSIYIYIYIILCVCSFLEHCSDPSMKSTCAEPHMSSVLMTDVISADSGEHVILHNLVRVSFTNKV